MIELDHISKDVGIDDLKVQILRDISLTVEAGEFVAIMGPSGSGKSTLMNIMGFLDVVTSGQYLFKGKDVSKLDEDELAQYRSMEVGFIFQQFNLLPKTTVLDNVKLPLMYYPQRKSDAEQKRIAEAAIESVGLTHRIMNLSNQLSGGEKQRVAIARSLVNNPSIILADEPTGNLDSTSGIQIMRILQDLNAQGKTVILVTHELITAEHAKRMIQLRDGQIESIRLIPNQRIAANELQLK